MVLASYVAGSPLSVARGLGVAALLSFTHISSAVLIALLALPIVAVSFTGAGRAPLLEDVSRAMIALIGAWMLLQAWRGGRHRHQDAPLFGAMAGLIPCPLTLFAMVLAVGRGAWEAGVMFAAAFFLGVTLTLSCVALIAFAARSNLGKLVDRFRGSMDRFGRTIEAGAGAILIVIGLQEAILR
jgi:nickel/cobalt transporter (NicO) family protein